MNIEIENYVIETDKISRLNLFVKRKRTDKAKNSGEDYLENLGWNMNIEQCINTIKDHDTDSVTADTDLDGFMAFYKHQTDRLIKALEELK